MSDHVIIDSLRIVGVLSGIVLVGLGVAQSNNDAMTERGAMFFIGGFWLISASISVSNII